MTVLRNRIKKAQLNSDHKIVLATARQLDDIIQRVILAPREDDWEEVAVSSIYGVDGIRCPIAVNPGKHELLKNTRIVRIKEPLFHAQSAFTDFSLLVPRVRASLSRAIRTLMRREKVRFDFFEWGEESVNREFFLRAP